MSNYFIAVQTVPVSLSVCLSSPIDIDMFDIFWLKSNSCRYVGYVLSQVQGISRVGLRCLSLFTSNPCPLFPRTLKKMTITVLAWSLRKVKHFSFFLVSLLMLFWFNLPAVRHGGPGWLRDHLGRDKRQESQALRKPGRQGRPGGVFKTQAGNLLTSWEPTLLYWSYIFIMIWLKLILTGCRRDFGDQREAFA